MSLKTFHIFFIGASVLLSFAVAVWSIQTYRVDGDFLTLLMAIVSVGGGVGLIKYGISFLKKLRHVSFL